ncbi:MAG: Holliday junction resolvase RuvX [Proteobacteria bacterium]|nr:Holliday junction resolvase RuvX [Pseudomonadota bacterium]
MIFEEIEQWLKHIDETGRIIGLDVGTKTIGVAICDDRRTICTPKLTIQRQSNEKDFAILKTLIEENKVKAIVVGLPLNMDGSESDMSEFVRRFSENLEQFLGGFNIFLQDERLSSFMAEDIIREIKAKDSKKKKLVDQIAASVILQTALDSVK